MTEVSKDYGTALFMLAKENNAEDEYAKALECIGKILDENPEYIDFLATPGIPKKERINAVEQAFSSFPEYVVSFMALLCERGRIREFKACAEEYKKLFDISKQVSKAKVSSPIELTATEAEELKKKLEKMSGHYVELECSVDKSLLGGIVIEIDGKVIDGSIQRRLKEVKDVISR